MQNVTLIVADSKQFIEVHASISIEDNEAMQAAMVDEQILLTEIKAEDLRVILTTQSGGVIILKGEK